MERKVPKVLPAKVQPHNTYVLHMRGWDCVELNHVTEAWDIDWNVASV